MRSVHGEHNARDADGLNVLPTGRRVTGDADGSSIQRPLASPQTHPSDIYPHWVNTSHTLTHSNNDPAPVDPFTIQTSITTETTPGYIMELHIITAKAKAKRGKSAEDFTIMKPPTQLSTHLTYLQFLEKVAKVAEVNICQLDCKHMRWKFQKPASASPTSISEDESYGIMIQAICSKKDVDCWLVVQMGKPLLSEAVGLVSFFV